MDYESFAAYIAEYLEMEYDDLNVEPVSILKNNDVTFRGLTLYREDNNVAPTIYLDDFYTSYMNAEIDITTICEKVEEIYEKSREEAFFDTENLTDYENVRKRIICKLINYERNIEFLDTVPFKKVMDLAVIFQIVVSLKQQSVCGTINVSNDMLRVWDVSLDQLYENAVLNSVLMRPFIIRPIVEVLRDMLIQKGADPADLKDAEEFECPMEIASNTSNQNGAAVMLYPGLLEQYARACESDYYILPSSVHELIFIPKRYYDDYEDLIPLVKEVNETQVKREEFLSNSIYYYEKGSEAPVILYQG